jgi:hypothetical protein
MPATFLPERPMTLIETRLQLLSNDYDPTACEGKDAKVVGWNQHHTAEQVASFTRLQPNLTNTGIRTANAPALDADILVPEVAEAIGEAVRDWFDGRGEILTRTGLAPKRAMLFRTGAPFRKMRVDFVAPNGANHHIEFLGDGQQVIVDGIHPDTHKPYYWHGGRSPRNVPRSELPEIDEAEARALLDYLTEMLREKFGFEIIEPQSAGGQSPFVVVGDKPPLDVEACLAGMRPNGASVNEAQPRVILSLLQKAIPPAVVIDTVVDATMAMAKRSGLDWTREAEVRLVTARCNSSLGRLHKEYEYGPDKGGIPVWLAGEFHKAWEDVLAAGKQPQLTRNGGGWYVRTTPRRYNEPAQVGIRHPAPAEEAQEQAPGPLPGPETGKPEAESGKKRYRFPLIPFGDLRPGSEQSYLIDELFPTAGLALVYGAPKSGKSFWTFDAMMHVALAWEYRERAVQPGPVVYCAFEGAHGYHKRGEAFRRHHCLTDERPPMFVVPGRADLIKDHAALIADMRGQLADAGITHPPRAVVLDTLNKSLIGSESKDVDMANYIAAAEAIQKAFNCLVVIVHHHGIEESRPRGHTSLRGAIDVMIKITRDVQNNIIAVVEEMRDGPEGAQIASRLVVITVGEDLKGRPLTSAAVESVEMATATQRGPRMTPNQKTMLSLLEEAGPGGLTTSQWNERAREAGLGKHRRATLADLRAELRQKRLVVEQGERWVTIQRQAPDL